MTVDVAAPTVASVMTPNPAAVRPHTPFKEIVELLAQRAIGAVPVVSATGRVVGVVSEADLLADRRARCSRWTASELMTSPAATVRSDAPLAGAARRLAESGGRQLFVVDDGRLVGVLARRAVLSVFLRPDKEIRAEIERMIGARPERSVLVSVEEGLVQLTGRLHARGELPAAAIAAIPGVVDVRDRVRYELG